MEQRGTVTYIQMRDTVFLLLYEYKKDSHEIQFIEALYLHCHFIVISALSYTLTYWRYVTSLA